MSRFIDGLPIVRSVSGFVRRGDGTSAGYILGFDLRGYEGAEAELLLNPIKAVGDDGVVDLDRLADGEVVLGYLFGGIRSKAAYAALVETPPTSVASDRFYRVILTRAPSPVTPMPPKPAKQTPVTSD